jgi:hypothetical protein
MFLTSLLAGLGGLLPSLSRIATSFMVQPEQPLPHWHILIALSIFFLLGSVLNIPFNRENDITKAIVVGISAPGLITNIIAGASNAPQSKLPQSAFLTSQPSQSANLSGFHFVNTAQAFSTPPSFPSASPTVPAGPTLDSGPSNPRLADQPSIAPQSVSANFTSKLVGPYAYGGVVEEPNK